MLSFAALSVAAGRAANAAIPETLKPKYLKSFRFKQLGVLFRKTYKLEAQIWPLVLE